MWFFERKKLPRTWITHTHTLELTEEFFCWVYILRKNSLVEIWRIFFWLQFSDTFFLAKLSIPERIGGRFYKNPGILNRILFYQETVRRFLGHWFISMLDYQRVTLDVEIWFFQENYNTPRYRTPQAIPLANYETTLGFFNFPTPAGSYSVFVPAEWFFLERKSSWHFSHGNPWVEEWLDPGNNGLKWKQIPIGKVGNYCIRIPPK